MKPLEITIKNLATITTYLDKKKLNDVFVEQVGRVRLFDKTEEFLSQYSLGDANKWSKREKNILVHVLSNNPHAKTIIDVYNQNIKSSGELKDRGDFLKNLSSISELMKASPYNELSFQENVYKNLMDWGFDDNKENIRLLRKSFNLYVDRPTIEDFIGPNSERKHAAFTFIKGAETVNKAENLNCTLGTSMAALASFAAMSSLNPISEILPKISEPISAYFGTNPLIATIATLGAMAYGFYKTFEMANKAVKEVAEKKREELISYVEPKKLDFNGAIGYLNIKLLGKIIWKEHLDVNDKDNKKFLALSAFANEKLSFANLKVPQQMINDFNLQEKEIKVLNKLDADKIHGLSLINDPAIRTILMTQNMSSEQSLVLKNLSLMKDIMKKDNKDGLYFQKASEITNLPNGLKKRIENMTVVEKQILTSFLNLQKTSSGTCPPGLLKDIDKSLSSGLSVEKTVKAELEIQYFNNKVEAPKNEELAYVQRVIKWIKQEEKMSVVNPEIKLALKDIGDKYHFTKVEPINRANQTIIGKIKTSGEDVLANIQNIRAKMSFSGRNNLQP